MVDVREPSREFLNTTPKAGSIEEKLNIKTKNFWSAKDNIKELKGQTTQWEKIFSSHKPHKGLLSKIYKELSNSTISKQTTQFKKMNRTEHFIKENL